MSKQNLYSIDELGIALTKAFESKLKDGTELVSFDDNETKEKFTLDVVSKTIDILNGNN